MFNFKNKSIIFITLIIFLILISVGAEENNSKSNKNDTCEKINSSEFPEDLFTLGQRKCGAIILHIIFAIYCFGAIAVVCSDRFLPTIACICQDLKLSDDVGAATFMSIATSTPELFSNIIGTFITESDIGIGHVIGNGYYNMFFVAALGGLAAKQEITLEWWPLARDCSIFGVTGIVLTIIVWDGMVKIYEAIILFSLYIIYFFIMFNDKNITGFLQEKFNVKINPPEDETFEEINNTVRRNEKEEKVKEVEEAEPLNSICEITLPPPLPQPVSKDENERWRICKKIFAAPIIFLIYYTIPDVRVDRFRKYYPAAFLICVAWIGISTYLGTWMVSVIGETVGISDLVMGMVFMAAGGSVVEAYSVYCKAKQGECKIGLSNSLGCNNLDITLCLALPWFIKTLPIQMSPCQSNYQNVILESSLIHINCSLLVISVIALFVIFYLNKFKLNKKLSLICGGFYVLVLLIGISVESYGSGD